MPFRLDTNFEVIRDMMDRATTVDVIVPVHGQRRLTEACLASVHAAAVETTFEVVVVDDASNDTALRQSLTEAAARQEITLLTNERNLGFTGSANRGMRLHPDRDVVLLNSDTVVFDGWLDRMFDAAYSGLRVASVNPLTNASHIGCYPFRSASGDVRFEMSDADLSAMAAEANRGRYVEVHTTIGFCMYIRRAVLDEVGLFDAKNFPIGYGEESDFCYRARRVGWRHLVAGDSFVRHWEGQTFGPRKARLIEQMIETFVRLHPDLAQRDREFAERDPVRPLRETLDLARLRRLLCGVEVVECRDAPAVGDKREAPALLLNQDGGTLRWYVPTNFTLPNLPRYRLPQDVAALNASFAFLGLREIRFRDAFLLDWLKQRFCSWTFEMTLAAALVLELH